MEIEITHDHECWDDVMDCCAAEEIDRLAAHLDGPTWAASRLHLTVSEQNDDRTVCTVHLQLANGEVGARESSTAMCGALIGAFERLLLEIEAWDAEAGPR